MLTSLVIWNLNITVSTTTEIDGNFSFFNFSLIFFWKICKTLHPPSLHPSYTLNVHYLMWNLFVSFVNIIFSPVSA